MEMISGFSGFSVGKRGGGGVTTISVSFSDELLTVLWVEVVRPEAERRKHKRS